ncbi:MAG: hypothetical protein AAF917_14055, partial [Pseudomonadota bacterium]
MRLKALFYMIFFILLATSASILAETAAADGSADARAPDILSLETIKQNHYLPDFSYAGYKNGLEALPVAAGTVIRVGDYDALPDDEIDD